MSLKRLLAFCVAPVMVFALAACGGGGAGVESSPTPGATDGESEQPASEKGTVGVAMPEQTLARWIADGNAVKTGLEEAGYSVDLQYAGNDIPTQQEQLDQMIVKGVDVLILASIDGAALGTQLDAAAAAGIPVIAYDRLLTGNENVDFYVTFDNYNVGVQQATSLLEGLGVTDASGAETDEKGPFNIEIFAGSPDDNNAKFFYNGAFDTLKPFLESGVLVVKSGQNEFGQVAIQGWDQAKAQSRMDDLLTSTYQSGKVDGVLAANDALGRGAINSMQSSGYTVDSFPPVTGQDAEAASAKLILEDLQYSTIFKDTRKLAAQAVLAAQDLLEGKEPANNDTSTYDNGVKVVPSFLLESDIVTKENIVELLVDSGYYTQDEIESGVAN